MPASIASNFCHCYYLRETSARQGNYTAGAFGHADAAFVTRFLIDFNNRHFVRLEPDAPHYSRYAILSNLLADLGFSTSIPIK
jgi:hypothetical protein